MAATMVGVPAAFGPPPGPADDDGLLLQATASRARPAVAAMAVTSRARECDFGFMAASVPGRRRRAHHAPGVGRVPRWSDPPEGCAEVPCRCAGTDATQGVGA